MLHHPPYSACSRGCAQCWGMFMYHPALQGMALESLVPMLCWLLSLAHMQMSLSCLSTVTPAWWPTQCGWSVCSCPALCWSLLFKSLDSPGPPGSNDPFVASSFSQVTSIYLAHQVSLHFFVFQLNSNYLDSNYSGCLCLCHVTVWARKQKGEMTGGEKQISGVYCLCGETGVILNFFLCFQPTSNLQVLLVPIPK